MYRNRFMPKGFDLKVHIPKTSRACDVLVAVHGISRNADEIFDAFVQAAGEHMIVVAPQFDAADFPDYQRLGMSGRGQRADLVLEAALERVEAVSGRTLRKLHLFGFSGGAQFAHRYAMFNPDRVLSLHAASAGWYTFPDLDVRWPYGLGGMRSARAIGTRLTHFKALPKVIYVGDRDTDRDAALRTGPDIDRQQGRHRVERAQRWAATVGAAKVELINGAGHSFTDCCSSEQKGLHQRVVENVMKDSLFWVQSAECCSSTERQQST